jgi:hypothetical protein
VWNDLELDLTADAVRHGLGGIDNALVDLSLAVEVRGSGAMDLYVDRLEIVRERVGESLFEVEQRMAADLSREGIVNHIGQEISYAAHLNAYGPDVPLADASAHPHGYTPQQAVAFVHEWGGVVSLNHFFGIRTKMMSHRFPGPRRSFDANLERLIANRAYGVDLLEVGYRERGHGLDAFVELWDGLAGAGIRLTGVGVSDSHDVEAGWTRGPNNFITWIMAASSSQVDLIEGLRAGRAFFGDPTLFDGRLDVTTPSGGRMGQVLAVPTGRQEVRFHAEGLREGQRLRLIRDGQPLRSVIRTGEALTVTRRIDIDGPTFVRLEVRADGATVALSNPLYFVPEDGAADIPAARRP